MKVMFGHRKKHLDKLGVKLTDRALALSVQVLWFNLQHDTE